MGSIKHQPRALMEPYVRINQPWIMQVYIEDFLSTRQQITITNNRDQSKIHIYTKSLDYH